MYNGGKSSGSLPFIKRDQIRRDFLRTRMKRNAPSKVGPDGVKKEDPEVMEEHARQLLQGGSGTGIVKREDASDYQEFPLRAANAKDLASMKVHLLKFQSKKKIEPSKDFHLPIRLHRKDTRNVQFQLTRAEIVQRQKEIAAYKKRLEDEKGSAAEEGGSVSTPSSAAEPVLSKGSGELQEGSSEAINEESKDVATEAANTPAPGTKLEDAGPAEDPSKIGLVKYDGKEPLAADFQAGTTDPLADVAPDGGGRFRRGNSKRKTRQLKLLDEKARQLRFEEFYPWVMEDFDGLNTWVGSYEAGNSDAYVFLSAEDDGSFTMIPADKVYRFTARNKYATLTIEEAEKRMEKNGAGAPRWLMKHLDNIGTTTTRYDRTRRRLKAVDGNDRQGGDDRLDNSEVELDYDEEFADDEEAPIIDGNEEENKESEQRIKKEMLQANAMGLRDDDLEDDDDALFGEKKIDEEGEKVKKALLKTDLGALYESDEDSNPYLSESEVEENDENKAKKEDQADDSLSRKSSPKKKTSRSPFAGPRIFVKRIKNCVIVLNADKSVLNNFPPGHWNPNAKKQKVDARHSVDNRSTSINQDDSTNLEGTDLLTEEDIVSAVKGKKITLKQLIKDLKSKISRHPENKARMKLYFKKLVKLNGEYLELVKG
ncbi:HHR025Cp [Eremothecium sinecaudum]|uniref:Transcription initiation factor IIF subunit alpha n=1 Tax=Eremothecium sinecaudum TaxID=45286 RepID=A0A0X8HWM1_9SACH|nr:HHR025Cp [Eremothecium sinecaudum]AMD22794.1 HHR025Cp [Eremothecium sinecaudum]